MPLLFGGGVVAAKNILLVKPTDKDVVIKTDYLEILEDPSGSLHIQEVIRSEFAKKFHYSQGDLPINQNTESTYWLCFKVKFVEEDSQQWLLEILDLHINHIQVFIQVNNQIITLPSEGYLENFKKRPYLHKNFVYDVPQVEAGQEITFYLRIKSENYAPFLFKLRRNSFFIHYALNEYYILGLYYGILLIMALYNAMIYFYVREHLYMYYVLYVISCILVSFGEDGLGFQYLWPHYPLINLWIDRYAPFLLLFSFIIYTQSFLEFKKHMPQTRFFLWYIMAAYTIYLFVIELFTKLYHPHTYLYLILLPFIILYRAAIYLYLKGVKVYTGFFLLGYSFTMIGIVNLILRKNGVVWDSIWFVYSLDIGFVVEVFFFSLAQAYRLREIKNEKEQAQHELILQLKENEKIIQIEVQQRTQEINRQKSIIEKQNQVLVNQSEELKAQAEEIKRINQLLNQENEQLQSSVKELTKSRVLTQVVDFEEFIKIFPDEDACYQFLAEIKWQSGYACNRCQNRSYTLGRGHFARRCTKCGYNESATVNTIFERSHLDLQKALYMLFLVYNQKENTSAVELSQTLGIRENTCGKFIRKIRTKMKNTKNQIQEGWTHIILD
ncbi:MAG: 7TM diverse intracellular signaling domain-containing protein [Microscillaceae bacterium]|nr:7TM diverse intracellular signaling domain-containing protein [Microscillaceae bacterium]